MFFGDEWPHQHALVEIEAFLWLSIVDSAISQFFTHLYIYYNMQQVNLEFQMMQSFFYKKTLANTTNAWSIADKANTVPFSYKIQSLENLSKKTCLLIIRYLN